MSNADFHTPSVDPQPASWVDLAVADQVHALCWLADPANVDPKDELLDPATRGPLVASVAAELSQWLTPTGLASLSSLQVIYLGFSLEAQASVVDAAVGARLGQLVMAEVGRRAPDGNLFDTMPTADLVELLAVVDAWTAKELRTRRNTWGRRLGAVLDRRLGLA